MTATRLFRRRVLAAGVALPSTLLPCLRPARATEATILRVGFQKGEPLLMAAKANRNLEARLAAQGIGVDWIEFQFGPPMLEAMRIGSIDLGAVGDTPPVFAQAAGSDLLYIAANRGAEQSMLLPPGSQVGALADLKGRKVAFSRGSSGHNFVLLVLEKAGLRYDEIDPIYLGPADAGAAFRRGAVDAWSIWEPYASLFAGRSGTRTLTTNKTIGEQFSFIMGNGPFVRANPALAASAIDVLTQTAVNAREHHSEIASLLSTATGIGQDVWLRALTTNPFQVMPVNDRLIRSQQQVADRFLAQRLLPVKVNVADFVWNARA